jgi:peroxiredoxin
VNISASVPSSPQDVCPVLTGTPIPAATLRTTEGDAFDLSEAVKQQPSVLIFYRGGW